MILSMTYTVVIQFYYQNNIVICDIFQSLVVVFAFHEFSQQLIGMTLKNFNVFVGTTTGCLKGVVVGTDICNIRADFQNLTKNKAEISNKNEITCMEWVDESSKEMVVGYKDKVKVYDTSLTKFVTETSPTSGTICGVFKDNSSVFAGLTSGTIESYDVSEDDHVWKEHIKLNGGPVERMKRSFMKQHTVATGGRDNDLKLWDLNTKSITFLAKNVKPDELQLQVPIWVSDIQFARRNETVSTCSRHGHVRVYDPLLPQRRPIFNCHQEDQVFTCLSTTPNERQMLVGGSSGDIFLVDIAGKTPFVGKYKGSCGAVKSIACPDSNNLVFSVSLDRHFRIHDFQTRKLLHKDYMMSRLTSVLPKMSFVLENFEVKKEDSDEDEKIESAPKKRKKDVKALNRAFDTLETIE